MKNAQITFPQAKFLVKEATHQFGAPVPLPLIQNESVLIAHGCNLWWGAILLTAGMWTAA